MDGLGYTSMFCSSWRFDWFETRATKPLSYFHVQLLSLMFSISSKLLANSQKKSSKIKIHPRKTNGWNLKIPPPPKGKGETSIQTTKFLASMLNCWGCTLLFRLTFSHLKMDGWNTCLFPFGAWRGLFSGANLLLVSGSVEKTPPPGLGGTTRSITFLVGNPYENLHLPLSLAGENYPRCISRSAWLVAIMSGINSWSSPPGSGSQWCLQDGTDPLRCCQLI